MVPNEPTQLPQDIAQHHSLILPVTLAAFLPCKNKPRGLYNIYYILQFVPVCTVMPSVHVRSGLYLFFVCDAWGEGL